MHPGLLGQPVPPELQQDMRVASGNNPATPVDAPMQLDSTGLRTQRSVYFEYNNADVKSSFDPALKSHARYLGANPKSRVRIEGNADERGSAGFNNILALKRASNVRQAIIGHGAAEKQVVVKSLGEAKPKLKGRGRKTVGLTLYTNAKSNSLADKVRGCGCYTDIRKADKVGD